MDKGKDKKLNYFFDTEKVREIKKRVSLYNNILDKNEKKRIALEQERLKHMLPKAVMVDGQYYNGYRSRGAHVGMWDAKKSLFIVINYFYDEPQIEKLCHCEDVELGYDCFIPFAMISPINF